MQKPIYFMILKVDNLKWTLLWKYKYLIKAVNYPITSLTNTNSNADTSIDNIDEWLKELSQKSKEHHTSHFTSIK